jgi:aryl-alcohol dehydrogenase-like predicted oxidoreductase
MLMRQLGKSGIEVSSVALGTMTWGRDTDEYEAREQVELFAESGGNLIDTADIYSDGQAEILIGEILHEMNLEHFVIATKSGLSKTTRRNNSSRKHLLSSLDDSLTRLKIDAIDLWQIHAYDQLTPLDELAHTLTHAVESGKVRYVGVSNFSAWQLTALQGLMPAGISLISTQNEYSLLQRGVERELVPSLQHNQTGLLAWSPLGRGVLTGKYRNNIPADSRAASPHWGAFTKALMTDHSRHVVDAVIAAAQGLGVAPLEVALAWVRDAPGVSSVITGSRTAGQLRSTLNACDLALPEQIRSALNDVAAIAISYPDAAAQH